MLFNTLHFGVFLVVVFTLAAVLRRNVFWRNLMLLGASYYFYAWWDWRFLGLLIFTTVFDWVCGRLLSAHPQLGEDGKPIRSGRDRLILASSMVLNLSVLGFFKYFNFFEESAAALLGHIGWKVDWPTLKIVLPVGISFYTFQSMSYVIDVYRGDLPGEKSILNFMSFVSFFPHLVAGPILRPTVLLPQLKKPNVITLDGIYHGFYLICWGLFKKVVIADNIAHIADDVFYFGTVAKGGTVLIGVYAFAVEIYCDFSAYTDIARGSAQCMGFQLMQNFNLPYFAVNPSDFWRRWHITLSTWLRDYLYIPLGGNRKGPARTYINLMVTMLLGGLWHGAAWTFVLWGAFHGALLCLHRAFSPWMSRWIAPKSEIGKQTWYVVRVLVMFHLVCFGWLLFRAESMQQLRYMMWAVAHKGLALDRNILSQAMMLTFLVTAGILLAVQLVQAATADWYPAWRFPLPVRAVVYASVILAIVVFGETSGKAFIYFQF